MLKLIKRLLRCRIVMINFEEKSTARSELLQPRVYYRKKYKML